MFVADSATAVLEAAQALAPQIRARTQQGEQLRTMPADLADRVEAAGLFALWLPQSVGGLELDPAMIVRIIEEISYADGSAGWTVLIGTSTAFFGWLAPEVARELIAGRPYGASSCVIAPSGSAVPNGADGLRVSGRWAFNTGVRHARFSQVGAVLLDEHGTPRTGEDGAPAWRLAFFPTDRGQILDTWDSAGLRGTGSPDLVLDGLAVPPELFVNPVESQPRHDGPLWRFPVFAYLNVILMGFPLGVARGALDDFAELARTKTRGLGQRFRVADDPHVQASLPPPRMRCSPRERSPSTSSGSRGTPRARVTRSAWTSAPNCPWPPSTPCGPRSRQSTGCSAWPEPVRSTPTNHSSAAFATCTPSTRTPTSAPRPEAATPGSCSGCPSPRSCSSSIQPLPGARPEILIISIWVPNVIGSPATGKATGRPPTCWRQMLASARID